MKNKVLLLLQLPTLLLPHPFIHLMLQCCLFTHPLMILNILLSQLLPLSFCILLVILFTDLLLICLQSTMLLLLRITFTPQLLLLLLAVMLKPF